MLWFDERELHISREKALELLKIPKEMMERLAKWTELNDFLIWYDNNDYSNSNIKRRITEIWVDKRRREVHMRLIRTQTVFIVGTCSNQYANNPTQTFL